MGHSNGIITAAASSGIDFQNDVAYVLGVDSGDAGTLCSSPAINPYAKHKPVRYPAVTLPATGYKAEDGSCGLNLTRLTAPQITQALVQAATRWSDDPKLPRGRATNNEWFRILDFDGYDHNAACPVIKFLFPDELYANKDYPALMIQPTTPSHTDPDKLTVYDLMAHFNLRANEIAANTTTLGYFGLLMIADGDDSVFCSRSRDGGSQQPTLDITMDSIRSVASTASNFNANKTVLLAPCICNVDTSGAWKNTKAYNDLQFILWPAELGAYQKYTLKTYTAPVQPDYYITVEYSNNPFTMLPQTTSTTEMTVTIQRRTGTGPCPSLYMSYQKYELMQGGQPGRFENINLQLLKDGGYDADTNVIAVETLTTNMKWRYKKTLNTAFFLTNTGYFGSKTLYPMSTYMDFTVKYNGNSMVREYTDDSQNLILQWYRN